MGTAVLNTVLLCQLSNRAQPQQMAEWAGSHWLGDCTTLEGSFNLAFSKDTTQGVSASLKGWLCYLVNHISKTVKSTGKAIFKSHSFWIKLSRLQHQKKGHNVLMYRDLNAFWIVRCALLCANGSDCRAQGRKHTNTECSWCIGIGKLPKIHAGVVPFWKLTCLLNLQGQSTVQ